MIHINLSSFAIVSGLVGASLSTRLVLILVFASLLADGFWMATSNYLSLRTRTRGSRGTLRSTAARHAGLVPLVAYVLPMAPS